MIRAERPAKSMPPSKAPVLTAPMARRQTARAFGGRREPAAVRGSCLAVVTPDGAARCGRIPRDALSARRPALGPLMQTTDGPVHRPSLTYQLRSGINTVCRSVLAAPQISPSKIFDVPGVPFKSLPRALIVIERSRSTGMSRRSLICGPAPRAKAASRRGTLIR